MILVLVNPAVALLSFHHELVVAETSIDKGVDEGAGEICTSRVHVCCHASAYSESERPI